MHPILLGLLMLALILGLLMWILTSSTWPAFSDFDDLDNNNAPSHPTHPAAEPHTRHQESDRARPLDH
jgi:hypothetical protein